MTITIGFRNHFWRKKKKWNFPYKPEEDANFPVGRMFKHRNSYDKLRDK